MQQPKKEGTMANITKRNNSNMPMALGGLFDRVFQNGLSRFFDDDFRGFNGMTSAYSVPVNLRETEKTYEMEVVSPGLRKEDFNVQVSGDMLTISCEHKDENREERKEEGYVRNEYRAQSFSRSFRLDDTVDANGISANYSDGILHVSLPKKEGAQQISKAIEVK
jgi:HSP20 family protein